MATLARYLTLLSSIHADPHFKTWSGKQYDFHGGCDLVGLGLTVSVRTSIKTWWSYIERAVVKIGEDTLEIVGGHESITYRFNGEEAQEIEGKMDTFMGDFPVHFKRVNQYQSSNRITLRNGDALSIETYKNLVRGAFVGSYGMLGSYPAGEMIGRDGQVIEDPIHYGFEWQVRDRYVLSGDIYKWVCYFQDALN